RSPGLLTAGQACRTEPSAGCPRCCWCRWYVEFSWGPLLRCHCGIRRYAASCTNNTSYAIKSKVLDFAPHIDNHSRIRFNRMRFKSDNRPLTSYSIRKPVMSRIEKVLYTGKTHTTGGRNGSSRSSDGNLDIQLSPPGTGTGTNPEQLF